MKRSCILDKRVCKAFSASAKRRKESLVMIFIFSLWYHEKLNFKCTFWPARVIEKTDTCTCIKKISTPLYRWGGTVALDLIFSWALDFEYLLHFINLNNALQYIWLWTLQFSALVGYVSDISSVSNQVRRIGHCLSRV